PLNNSIQLATLVGGMTIIGVVVDCDHIVAASALSDFFPIPLRPNENHPFANPIRFDVLLAHSLGIALCILEAGAFVALVLSVNRVTISPESRQRLKHGGLIGSLERLLIYIFVINNTYNAAAFILTAKTIVRFKELVHEDDSEYVLVG